MKPSTPAIIFLALFVLARGQDSPDIIIIDGGLSGDGITTRYWDCCKPSCSWKENIKTPSMVPVQTCEADGVTFINASATSGCDIDGVAYMCNDQQPWVVNSTLAFGFAAASFSGGVDTNMCCACFLLTFTGELSGKQMVIQNTNTGSDLSSNQFDIATPGGGVGIFDRGCSTQWNAPADGWGDRYGGVSSIEQCDELPEVLQPGCRFRFQFMEGISNPQVHFAQVICPDEIVKRTGCDL